MTPPVDYDSIRERIRAGRPWRLDQLERDIPEVAWRLPVVARMTIVNGRDLVKLVPGVGPNVKAFICRVCFVANASGEDVYRDREEFDRHMVDDHHAG